MNTSSIQGIVNAVLYEGYMLYPYRASSVKNRQRWTFGGVYPQAYSVAQRGSEPWMIQTQCLLQGGAGTLVAARPGFLHLVQRAPGELAAPLPDRPEQQAWHEAAYRPVDALMIDGQRYIAWQEAVEGEVKVAPLRMDATGTGQQTSSFVLQGQRDIEPLRNAQGAMAGVLVRTRERIEGVLEMRAERVRGDVFRITARVTNRTPFAGAASSDSAPASRDCAPVSGDCDPATRDAAARSRDAAALKALISCHLVLTVSGGRFLSSIDPPPAFAAAAAECENIGVWPVLVGKQGSGDTMLAAPIILYDYPQIARESPGDLFDGTEIDEILTLRILTMTEQEKRDMAMVDERARALLERTESLSQQQLAQLHGSMHGAAAEWPSDSAGAPWESLDNQPRLASVTVAGVELRVGDLVRLRPRARADILDLALAGMVATIESLERDFEERVHIAVTLQDDPGRDLGLARMPGHRFFFGADEVEPMRTPQEGP